MTDAAYPRLEFLSESSHLRIAALFGRLHLLVDLLLSQAAKVASLVNGLLDDLLSVLSLLSQHFHHFSPLALAKTTKGKF